LDTTPARRTRSMPNTRRRTAQAPGPLSGNRRR
jgi:hypothetical protein